MPDMAPDVSTKQRPARRLPPWFKVPQPGGAGYIQVQNRLRSGALNTVCQEARCPNVGDCWDRGTATFMVLGDICTRACRYCAVTSGRPAPLDPLEPHRLAQTVETMGLRYCVITSVDRDDLPDGGASIFAECINQVRLRVPGCRVEVLVPDFQGSEDALRTVMQAAPDVLNHNIETVARVFPTVRPRGDYQLSLRLLARCKEARSDSVIKSGLMVGLGETVEEVLQTMRDLRQAGCDLLTIGQYLRPSPKHHPVARYYTPEEFQKMAEQGRGLGFRHVASGPLVRSSYHADTLFNATGNP